MTIHTITSTNNQRVKDAVKLRERRQRSRSDRTLIDGAREIRRAAEAGARFIDVFACEPLCATRESIEALAQLQQDGATVWHVSPEVFEKLAFGHRREGLVAVIETPSRTLDHLSVPPGSLIAVVAGVEKPGNVGAVLRSADAAGVAGVIVADPATDLFNPNCIRASLGTVFAKNVCASSAAETLAWLRQRDASMFAARLDAEQSYLAADYRGESAIILGSEAAGLSGPWQAADITPIKLPMHGTADSLNVSATAAVLFYEALRQRAQG